tara:strand:+ start:219 stop:998 length:780 start_codon:yes stop_codon:yes gene_type:complete
MVLSKIAKLPIFKRLIPSVGIRLLKILGKNRKYYSIKKINMYLDFLDPIDREIIIFEEFEKLEIDFLINEIKKNSINYFLDVGANCGFYSLIIAKEIDNISIYSFEPNPEAYFKFLKSLEKNQNLSNKIKLENFGLSDNFIKLKMQSMVKFGYAQTGGTSVVEDKINKNNHTFHANFKTGDEYIYLVNKNLAIKIDVEGHELKVLNGLERTLKTNRCIIQIEIFNSNFTKVNKYLNSLGYTHFYKIDERLNYFYSNFSY